VALLVAACGGGAASTSVPAPAGSPTTTPTADAGAGEAVTFATSDGLTLHGRLFGSGEDGVVLAHMRPASMESWFPFAAELASAGYAALAFDFRGYGASEGSGFAVDVDVRAAIDALVERGALRVFVIGASMGGTGAIAASVGEEQVAGIVTLSAPARFEGTDAAAAIVQLDRPVLLIAAEDDEPYHGDARALQEAADSEADLVVLAGNRHGTDLFVDHGEALRDTILGFLADPT
jgi:pimeloyl-ACP methyl ester carboxylesterase